MRVSILVTTTTIREMEKPKLLKSSMELGISLGHGDSGHLNASSQLKPAGKQPPPYCRSSRLAQDPPCKQPNQ